MKLRLVVVIGGALLVAACQARGYGESVFMTSEEKNAKDDTTCRGYGAAPGSSVYVECRMRLAETRSREASVRKVLLQMQ
jgi:hypothetical protein